MIYTAQQALSTRKSNSDYLTWNKSSSSSVLSKNPHNASNRIFDDYAIPNLPNSLRKHSLDTSKVFTMGSCFAREIERALRKRKGNITSMNNSLTNTREFHDASGNFKSGFFHRYTPTAMLQELQIACTDVPEWDIKQSLIFNNGEVFEDFNYCEVGFPADLNSITYRRRIANQLVSNFKSSDVIILTLGLNESWLHKPTGLHCNRINPKILHKSKEDFELHILSHTEVSSCLKEIHALISKFHVSGKFELVLTVSPVPMRASFHTTDIVLSNEYSKSTLRSAVGEFCMSHDNVSYFPSYEMVRYSKPNLAWRPDRVHINPEMVQKIVDCFIETYMV